jgi:hypothetical protein
MEKGKRVPRSEKDLILKYKNEVFISYQTFTVFLPADHTPFIQLVDDNVGKSFRDMVYEQYDVWIKNYNPKDKLSSSKVRNF